MTDLLRELQRVELHAALARGATMRATPWPEDADPEAIVGWVRVDRGPVLAVIEGDRGLWFVGASSPSARAGHVLRSGFASWDKVRALAARQPARRQRPATTERSGLRTRCRP